MKSFLNFLKVVCYISLAMVAGALMIFVFLAATDACPSISTGNFSCSTPLFKALAELGVAVFLLSAFTGVPLLFAGLAFVFLLHDYFLWNSARKMKKRQLASPATKLNQHHPSFLLFLLKGFGIVMGLTTVAGAMTGA